MTIVTNHYTLDAAFDKCSFDLSQCLWNVRSRLMDYRIVFNDFGTVAKMIFSLYRDPG